MSVRSKVVGGAGPPTAAFLIAPGAGADRNQSALLAMESAVSELGVAVERMDFPYRKAGRRSPDPEPVLLEAVRLEAATLVARAAISAERLILGGRSLGGRICSMDVADGLPALALVLVSYPLHPPGRPDRLRTAHFDALRLPCLFVSGTRDAFGTPAELEAATSKIPGRVTHVWLEGKDHSLRGCDDSVADALRTWVATVLPA